MSLAFLLVLGFPGVFVAQFDPSALGQPPTPPAFRSGTQGFRQLLHKLGFDQPLDNVEALHREPERKLLVVLGDTSILQGFDLGKYLEAGGAALIATDRRWDSGLGVRVDGRFVQHAHEIYHTRECPFVSRTPGTPLFTTTAQAATNRPSFLVLSRSPQNPFVEMAQLPFGCFLAEQTRFADPTPEQRCFAAGASWGQGRVLVVADHSMFINDMLLRDDTFTVNFAVDALTWVRGLTERRQVLFVDEGHVVTNFQESLALPLPPPQALTQLLNSSIRSFEEEDGFNSMVRSMLARWIEPNNLLLVIVALLTLILVGYGFLRLGKNRHRIDKDRSQLAALLARPATSAAVVELRHRAMLEEGNLWEAARALTRQCFVGALGDRAAEMSQLAAEWGEPPRVIVAGGWWRRWQVGQLVRRLWQLAYDPVPVPVSAREFTHLAAHVRVIRAALEDGTVRIEPP